MKALAFFSVASLIVVCLVFAGTSYAQLPGVAAAYPLDDGSGKVAKDFSGNGNDGVFVGNPQWVTGRFGKALSFSGKDDYVQMADSDSLDVTGAITLMAWVYPTVLSNGVEGIIARWKYSGGDERSYLLATSDRNNGVRFQLSPDGTGGKEKVLFSDVGLETNKWTHIACTSDGSTMKVYFNGVEHGSIAYDQGIYAGIATVNIGTLNDDAAANRVFDGIIDEVVILSAPLTQQQVAIAMSIGIGSLIAAVSPSDKLSSTWGEIKTQY